MDSPSSLSQAKTFLYVISFSFLELCFLFLLLRRNHGLMPERKGKKIKHVFVVLYKKLMAFLGDNILAGASTRSLKSASHSSPFQFLHKPIQLKGQIISEQKMWCLKFSKKATKLLLGFLP